MAPKKEQALAVAKPNGLAAPSHIKAGSGRGKEKLTAKDMTLPFLRLAQDKTPQVENEEEGFKKGVYFNSVTNEIYGETVDIIVIAAVASQMRFGEYGKKEGILCQAPDGVTALAPNGQTKDGKTTNKCGDCVLAQWGEDGEKPGCMKQGRLLVMRPGNPAPMLLVLQSTNFPVFRKINSMLAANQSDMFASVVRLSVVKGNKAMNVVAALNGWAEEDDYHAAEGLYESARKMFFGGELKDVGAHD